MSTKKSISVIIPCYNEEKNIERFPDELFPALDKLGRKYEVIAIDDGSHKDDTWEVLKKMAKKHSKFIAIKHSRNYGMGAAYQTGFDRATGDYVIIYSSDLEIAPKYIEEVIAKLDDGYDLVNTNRTGRWQETGSSSIVRRVPSNAANKLITRISGVSINDTGSGLKGFRKFITDNLKIYGDMHRFLPAYASLYTKKITEFDVEYQERTYGTPAYGSLMRTFTVFLDLFSMKFMLSFATKPFSMMPGRLFGTTGIISLSLGGLIGIYLFVVKFFLGEPIGGRPLLILGMMLILIGVQFIMIGLLGELMTRTYFESSNKTPYIVSEEEN